MPDPTVLARGIYEGDGLVDHRANHHHNDTFKRAAHYSVDALPVGADMAIRFDAAYPRCRRAFG